MLRSLENTCESGANEIVMIDDASSDGTREFLRSSNKRYRILLNESNIGFAASNNRAAKAASGDILVFLNNDLELSEGWLEPMLELLENEPNVGAVGNIQRNFKTGLVDHAGIFFDPEGMPTHAHKNRKSLPRGDWKERNAATAACMAIRKSVFEEIGRFDEKYANGMEDVDLCVRLKQAGFRILVSHRSVIRHHISQSPGRHLNNERNTERFRKKWSAFTSQFGRAEWPIEYFRRYARNWWRMNPSKAIAALKMLISK